MASSEKFCLRWNDFESNISVAFRELREEKDFFDVTLACDDSQIQAHKVILSACSPFFRNILRRNPHQHPLLYLKGVKYSELISVLNFMYQGEVNVAQEELNSFLSVAEDLKVKGLTQNNSEASSKDGPKQDPHKQSVLRRDPPESDLPGIPPAKRPRPVTNTQNLVSQAPLQRPGYHAQEEEDDIQEVVPVKSEPRDPPPPQPMAPDERQRVAYQEEHGMMGGHDQGTVALEDAYGDESYDYGQYGEGYDDGSGLMDPNSSMAMGGDGNKGSIVDLDSTILSKMEEYLNHEQNSKMWRCIECGHESRRKNNIFQHVERKHTNLVIDCHLCPSQLSSRYELNAHILRKHTNK